MGTAGALARSASDPRPQDAHEFHIDCRYHRREFGLTGAEPGPRGSRRGLRRKRREPTWRLHISPREESFCHGRRCARFWRRSTRSMTSIASFWSSLRASSRQRRRRRTHGGSAVLPKFDAPPRSCTKRARDRGSRAACPGYGGSLESVSPSDLERGSHLMAVPNHRRAGGF